MLVVHVRDEPLFAVMIPSKTQAYLAAGRPIFMAVRGDVADLARQAQREAMGRAGQAFYSERLAMARGVDGSCRLFADWAAKPDRVAACL